MSLSLLLVPLEAEFPIMGKPLDEYEYPLDAVPLVRSLRRSLIEEADGFVVISFDLNGGDYLPTFESMMNRFPLKSYEYKPCSIVCYSIGKC